MIKYHNIEKSEKRKRPAKVLEQDGFPPPEKFNSMGKGLLFIMGGLHGTMIMVTKMGKGDLKKKFDIILSIYIHKYLTMQNYH